MAHHRQDPVADSPVPSRAPTPGRFIVLVRWLAAYTLLNAPFWWWGQHAFISRPWFNVELMVPALLIGFYPALGYLCLLVAWLLDCLVSQSATFYFTSPLDFLRSIQFLDNLSWREWITWDRLVVLVPFLLAAWLLPKAIGRSRKGWWIGVALPVVIAVMDIANGSSMLSGRPIRLVDANIAGSPSVTLLVRTMARTSDLPLVKLDAASSTRGLLDIQDWATAHPSRSALLILVESFGLHASPEVRAWLERQLWNADISQRYRKIDGHVPFHGSTTNGELRELCGMAGSYRKVGAMKEPLACLPQALDDMGWTTTGLHGFSQAMFLRSMWWPRTGLQHMDFAEQLLGAESPRCGGAFAGACDADVIGKGFAIARSPRQFVYVLTLNSHLPIKTGLVPDDLQTICTHEGIEVADCQFVSTVGRMLRAVRQGMTDAPADNVPLVVLAGDHAPPFSDREIRQRYSQTQVQAFALVPLN